MSILLVIGGKRAHEADGCYTYCGIDGEKERGCEFEYPIIKRNWWAFLRQNNTATLDYIGLKSSTMDPYLFQEYHCKASNTLAYHIQNSNADKK